MMYAILGGIIYIYFKMIWWVVGRQIEMNAQSEDFDVGH
jgi:hypothetical protein